MQALTVPLVCGDWVKADLNVWSSWKVMKMRSRVSRGVPMASFSQLAVETKRYGLERRMIKARMQTMIALQLPVGIHRMSNLSNGILKRTSYSQRAMMTPLSVGNTKTQSTIGFAHILLKDMNLPFGSWILTELEDI